MSYGSRSQTTGPRGKEGWGMEFRKERRASLFAHGVYKCVFTVVIGIALKTWIYQVP